MGTHLQEMPVVSVKIDPISLLCVWEPFTDHWHVPMKLGGIWCPWDWIMPWKDEDSDWMFMMIPSVSCCMNSGRVRLNWVWVFVRVDQVVPNKVANVQTIHLTWKTFRSHHSVWIDQMNSDHDRNPLKIVRNLHKFPSQESRRKDISRISHIQEIQKKNGWFIRKF